MTTSRQVNFTAVITMYPMRMSPKFRASDPTSKSTVDDLSVAVNVANPVRTVDPMVESASRTRTARPRRYRTGRDGQRT